MQSGPRKVVEKRTRALRWIALVALLLTAVPVRAEVSVELTLARALFEEGVGFAESGDWPAAADRFERAYTIKPSAGVAYNWASALVALNQLVHATELLDQVLRDASVEPALQRECEQLRASLAPRVARLRVSIPDKGTDSTEIWVDGFRWPRPAWGVASPMNPGDHVAYRLERGREVARVQLALAEGEQRALELAALGPRDLAAPQPAVVLATPDERDRPSRDGRPMYKNPWLWTGVGVVLLAGVVAGVVAGSRGGEKRTEQPVVGNTGEGVIRW